MLLGTQRAQGSRVGEGEGSDQWARESSSYKQVNHVYTSVRSINQSII
jgi:hypothetical protein